MRFLNVLSVLALLSPLSIQIQGAPHGDDNDWRVKYDCCIVPPQPCNQQMCAAWADLNAVKEAVKVVKKADQEYTHAERMIDTGVGEADVGLFTRGHEQNQPQSLGDFIRKNPPKEKKVLLENEASLSHHISKSKVRERLAAASLLGTSETLTSADPYAPNALWADGIVYYDIDDNTNHIYVISKNYQGDLQAKQLEQQRLRQEAKDNHRVRIVNSMNLYETNTCIYFAQEIGPAPDHLQVKFTIGKKKDSSADALGRAAKIVQLGLESHDTGTASHEIGHLLGLDHTHQRHDRDDFLDYDKARCEAAYVGGQRQGCDTEARLATAKTVCTDPTVVADKVIAPGYLTYKTPVGYDKTNDAHVLLCSKKVCAEMWSKQYALLAEVDSPIAGSKSHPSAPVPYDYGSIMHYGLDDYCCKPKVAANNKSPQYDANNVAHKPGYLNAPTETDYQAVRAIYECYKIKVKIDGQADLDMYVNGGWTILTVKMAAGKRWPAKTATDLLRKAFLGMEATFPDPSRNGAPSVITDQIKLAGKIVANTVITLVPDGTTAKQQAEAENKRKAEELRRFLEEQRLEEERQIAADKRISDKQWQDLGNWDGAFGIFVEVQNDLAQLLPNPRQVIVYVRPGMTAADIKTFVSGFWKDSAQIISDAHLILSDPVQLRQQHYVLLPGHVIGTAVGGSAKIKEWVVLRLYKNRPQN